MVLALLVLTACTSESPRPPSNTPGLPADVFPGLPNLGAGVETTVEAMTGDGETMLMVATIEGRHRLQGLLAPPPSAGLVDAAPVDTAHGEGEITSGTFSPTLGKSIALASLPVAVAVGDVVHVAVRDKRLAARVVKPPFARNGKVLVS